MAAGSTSTAQRRRISYRRSGVEDTGGNSDGVGTDNNHQGCSRGVGSGRLLPLSLFPSSSSSLSSLPFPSLLQLLFWLIVNCLCRRHRRASHRGGATDDAALPPRCQAGRHRHVIATTNTATLSPLPPKLCHRRRCAIPVTARGAASTVATLPPPLPRCQAGRHLRAAAAVAAALTPQPPPPSCYPTPPC